MTNATPIIEGNYLLQKMQGKGGWTYILFPELKQIKQSWFGMTKVSGEIDGFQLVEINLMPFGNGLLFLPVKSEIRKIIGKAEGDWVHVTLYSQSKPPVTVNDFYNCLRDEPDALIAFEKLSDVEQEKLSDWIFSVKNDDTIVERIAIIINRLLT